VSRRIAALLLGAIYAIGIVYGMLVLVLTPPPPPPVRLPEARPALARHVLFVIVDGLRYDVATDPARMPRFAEAMQSRRSAEIYAGRISMTSAAVQSYGTGQRGRIGLIVRNINPARPLYNTWLQNAAERGLTLALAGDPTWTVMYGPSLRYALLDPEGVAMDHDFNERTFSSTRELLGKRPNFLISHFVTPDHQAHVYGILSERYRRHMHDFDARLFELLREVPDDWTVIVTSDHGANDAGTHGSDALVQRRSPIFAYGPGIAPKGPAESLEQADMAGTLAALVGAPGAAHSHGHLLVDWLDVSDTERTHYACLDGERAVRYARAAELDRVDEMTRLLSAACARADEPLKLRHAKVRKVVGMLDAGLSSAQDLSSPASWAFLIGALLSAAVVGWLLVGEQLVAGALCAASALIAIALVASIEHLPGGWPKRVDAALFVVFNLPSLLFLFKPERLVRLLDERPRIAAVIVPGAFAVTYPSSLQPVAYALCIAAPLTIALGASADRWGDWWKWRRPELLSRLVDLAFLLGWAAALAPGGVPGADAASMIQHVPRTLAWALALLATVAWLLARRSPRAGAIFAGIFVLTAVSLLLRRLAPPWLGRPLMLGLPVLGALLIARRRFDLGVGCMLAGFLWVSRDFEVISVAGGFGVAALLGERLALLPQERWTRGRVLIASGLLFCVLFVVRVGVSNGLNPMGMDFAAGAFGDKHVSAAWITVSVLWKYLVVALGLMLVFLRGAPRAVAERVVLLVVAIGLCRAAVLLGMMQCSPGSFWVLMRVLSDLPFALLFAIAAALLLLWSRWRLEPAS
jgi:hypothetical protein